MIRKNPSIFLADLRHGLGSIVSNACMPLGIGYMKAVMDRDLPGVDSRLFAYPESLLAALGDRPPDVLMLTNYVWNEALSLHFAKLAKRASPATLVVLGGPNIPVEADRQREFMEACPDVDVYALGEGDLLATEIVQAFVDCGLDVRCFAENAPESTITKAPDGTVRIRSVGPRTRILGDIPSPWLGGAMDQFFDGKLIPLMETHRGCPFKCSYCVQGDDYYNKVSHFETERIKEELSYIAARIQRDCPQMGALTFADPNFGIAASTLAICEHIGELQAQTGWPSIIDASTGKNVPARIIDAIEKLGGALTVLHAVQSLDDGVLEKINRANIQLEAYERVTEHIRGRGLRSVSQTILGLPGESLETHVAGLTKLMDSGIDSLQNFQLILLPGSGLEGSEARARFDIETRFRISPRAFGDYSGEHVFDVEEVVVATNTMSIEDYLEARRFHLACIVFWNQSWFSDILHFARRFGIDSRAWIVRIVDRMNRDEGAAGAFVRAFIEETKGELFPTAEACRSFYRDPKNYSKLERGELGDNLMNKYRAIASFRIWPELCELAVDSLASLMRDHGACDKLVRFESFWADVRRFVYHRHAHGKSSEEILAPAQCTLSHDIPRWIHEGCGVDLTAYLLPGPTSFCFQLGKKSATEVSNALSTWSNELSGLTKAARHLVPESQARDCIKIS